MNRKTLLVAGLLLISSIIIGELLNSYNGTWDPEIISFFRGLVFGVGLTLLLKELIKLFKKSSERTAQNATKDV